MQLCLLNLFKLIPPNLFDKNNLKCLTCIYCMECGKLWYWVALKIGRFFLSKLSLKYLYVK
ncbi:hypothetical protein EMIT019CA3_130043 [Bacillus pseudomycoides]